MTGPCVCLWPARSASWLSHCDPTDCSPPGSSLHGDSPGKNGASCHALSPGELPNPGIKPGLLHGQVDSLPLSHQEGPLGHGGLCKWHGPSFKTRSGVSWLQPAEICSSYQTQHLPSTCLSGAPRSRGRGWSMRWLSSLKTFRGMA